MADPTMSGAQILAFKPADYARLFPSKDGLQQAFRALVKIWHPDRSREANAREVFERIVLLHEAACRARDDGTWSLPNVLRVTRAGKPADFQYLLKAEGPAGSIHIGRQCFIMTAGAGMLDLSAHAAKTISLLPAAPAKMKEEFDRLLPRLQDAIAPVGAAGYAVMKTPQMIRLRDLIAAKGPLDPKHVAWIMSGAYNLACYLEFAGITHLGLDADHIFITPETHEVALLAGWEFAALRHGKPKAAPPATAALLGKALTADPVDRQHHLTLIRALGRAALGDPAGARLTSRSDLPRPFVRWLQFPAGGRAQTEYGAWGTCLVESWGPRRYQQFSITSSDIYGG